MVAAKPQILLTNDDGADSPILVPLLRELSGIAQVCTVVPASECSWTSKIISRFKPLALAEIACGDFAVQTLDGYPADCANVGIHHLCPEPPALVVSGINMGTNAGLAFALSSGTIGAAVEGVLSGVPAAAFSLELPREDFAMWRRERRLAPALDELLGVAVAVAGEIVAELLARGLPQGADMVTVNMPANTTRESPRRLTGVARTGYGSLFTRHASEPRFDYRFSGMQFGDESSGGDIAALERGDISITPLCYTLDAKVVAEDRQRFERGV